MRILAIAPTSFFADYGCHVRIRGQLTALTGRGHAVRLVAYPSGRDVAGLPITRAPWPGAGAIQVGSSRLKIALYALLAPTALAVALRFRPDVIHAYLHEGALIGWAIATLLRRPLVFDFQGSLTAEMLDHRFLSPSSRWLPLLQRLERWIDQRPAAVLVSSAHGRRLLADRFGVSPGRIISLPDSVDPSFFRPAAAFDPAELAALRARLGLRPGCRVIVYLGLLATYQGTDLLLAAMARLAERYGDVHLLLMGFPFVDRYRRQAAALGLAGRVTLTGGVPYEAAPIHLALGEIAVAPKLSATEGSGKALTYMAAGLPVAATDIPIHREYLGQWGVFAPPNEPQALAGALGRLLDDPAGAALRGQKLREHAERAYTWSHAADIVEGVYQSMTSPCGVPFSS